MPAWQKRQAFVGNHYASEIYASPSIFWLNGTVVGVYGCRQLKAGDAAQPKGCSASFVLVRGEIQLIDIQQIPKNARRPKHAGVFRIRLAIRCLRLTLNEIISAMVYNEKSLGKSKAFVGAEGVEPPTLCL